MANQDVFETPHTDVRKGDIDEIESISSDHHGGLQLNLKKNGRGWSDFAWDKYNERL